MKTLKNSRFLSKTLVKIGKKFKKDRSLLITNMHESLGHTIVNILEIKKDIDILKNKGSEDIILLQSKIADNDKKALKMLEDSLKNKKAFLKFKEFIKEQGEDVSYIDNQNKFDTAKNAIEIISDKNCFI